MKNPQPISQVHIKSIAIFLAVIMVFTTLYPAQVSAASRPAQIKSLKVTAVSKSSVKLSWKKSKRAKGYQIYRAASKNGVYKKVKTIKKAKTTKWVNIKLKPGKRYWYKVRAYNGSKKGKFSAKQFAITDYMPPNIDFRVLAKSASEIQVSWKRVASISGYRIYYSSDGKTYTTLKTVSSNQTAPVVKSGLKADTKYYFKTRTYRVLYGKVFWGKLSPAKYAVTKSQDSQAEPTIPTEPASQASPTTPTNPGSKPNIIVRDADGKEVRTLEAGKVYTVTKVNLDEWPTSSNRAVCNCVGKLYPVSKGTFSLVSGSFSKQYTVTKGVSVSMGTKRIELGETTDHLEAPTEKLETIYGYAHWIYADDYTQFCMLGIEKDKVVSIYTTAKGSQLHDDTKYATMGGVLDGAFSSHFQGERMPYARFVSALNYWGDKNKEAISNWSVISDARKELLLENLSKEVSYITNAVRVTYYDKPALMQSKKLNQIAREYSGTMKAADRISHELDGTQMPRYDVIHASCNENIAGGMLWQAPVSMGVFDNYFGSVGHRATMLSSWAKIGSGIAAAEELSYFYHTANFAKEFEE